MIDLDILENFWPLECMDRDGFIDKLWSIFSSILDLPGKFSSWSQTPQNSEQLSQLFSAKLSLTSKGSRQKYVVYWLSVG